MKTELQDKLLKKYPQFFTTTHEIYIGKEETGVELAKLLNQKTLVLPIQFGFECGNGWYMLLDELMGEIQQHLENANRNRKRGNHKYKFLEKWSYNWRIRSAHNQTFKKKIGEWIEKNAPRVYLPPLTIQVDQVKEKFGGLRFYYSGGDDEISGMVGLAESLSYNICETCGNTKNIGRTKGWITTMCQECYDKHPRKDLLPWEIINR